jgi:hypothetical protein
MFLVVLVPLPFSTAVGPDGIAPWLAGGLAIAAVTKVLHLLLRRFGDRDLSATGPALVYPDLFDVPGRIDVAPLPSRLPPVATPAPARVPARAAEPDFAEPRLYRPEPQPRQEPEPPRVQAKPEDLASETIQFEGGFDGRVQFLPGRLEILCGPDAGMEFHFLRLPGQAVPEVTIGRAAGPTHRHIQIAEGTVSRMHAHLRYDGGWHISNLSTSNPVQVNGQRIGSVPEAVLLTNGDRIQLGGVELCYRDGSR